MIKWRPLAALATALLVTSAACSSGGQGSAQSQGGGVQQITFWSFLRNSDAVAAAFNATHPNIKVTFVNQAGGPSYYSKLSDAIKSGQVPDVAVAEYTRLPEIVSLGGATDLTSQAGSLVQQTYPTSIQNLVTLGGKTWGVPRDAAPMLYFYRKDFFTQHGLSVPQTWAQFTALAQKVKQIDSSKSAATFATDDFNMITGLSWQAGAQWFGTTGDSWNVDIDDQASVKVAAYWQNLVTDKLVDSVPSYTDSKYLHDLTAGNLVGYICASWCASSLPVLAPAEKGDWAVAQLPTWDGTAASGMWGGSSFIVPKGAKDTAAAVEFIKWITTDAKGVASWYKGGTSSMYPASPALVSVAKKSYSTAYYDGQDIFAVDTASYDSVPTNWRWGPAMASTEAAFENQLGKVAQGSTQLTDVFTQAQSATVSAMQGRGLSIAK